MKRAEVKSHIGKTVMAAFIKVGEGGKHVTIKGEGLLHSADPITEIAEVWMRTGERVLVHFWHLRKVKAEKALVEDRIKERLTNIYTEEDVKKAFECLIEATEIARFYGDPRSWLVNMNGNFLGEVRNVKWSKAREFLNHVEKSFV